MPYVPPVMPLAVEVWTPPDHITSDPPTFETVCQLKMRMHAQLTGFPTTAQGIARLLFLPPLTDVRSWWLQGGQGSFFRLKDHPAHCYLCLDWEDAWKGLPNEYRAAVVVPYNPGGTLWLPFPID